MDVTIIPHKLNGALSAISSKSVAHRLLICAAFADNPTTLECAQINDDIAATVACLCSLGANISRNGKTFFIEPAKQIPYKANLYCKESGSTLRFLLPVVGALGIEATFHTEGRLWHRPLSPLWEEMERMGCTLSKPVENQITCCGKLVPGAYRIRADVSSQFISGLLFAMILLHGVSSLGLAGNIESAPYITMTQQAIKTFGVNVDDFSVPENHSLHSPEMLVVEGDWSNAAFFLSANSLGNAVNMQNLNYKSAQGDRHIQDALKQLENYCEIDAKDIPDLVPIMAVVAGAKKGAKFTNIGRLRLKESDRVASVCSLLTAIGGKAEADNNTLTVYPTGYTGGIVDAANDHRIAMSAAIAATVCSSPVTINGAECVKKSYPDFWNHYQKLGGVI